MKYSKFLWYVQILNLNFIPSNKYIYYDPKLGLCCNLGKDLRKDERDNKLVKCKDTDQYILLCILIDYKGSVQCLWVIHKENIMKPSLIHEMPTNKTWGISEAQ